MRFADIWETYHCGLSKAVRKRLQKMGVKRKLPVVFSAEPGSAEFTDKSVVYFARQPIKTGKQTIHVVVDRRPTHAGVDPYNKRIDRNSTDNVAKVEAP